MKRSWKKEGWLGCALMVAACQTVEGPGASLPPSRAVNQVGGFPLTLSVPSGGQFALQQAADWVATASNTLGALVPARVVDGNLSTQWANGEFRAASAWLAVDTGAMRPMAAVRVKLAPFAGGASYRIEVSDDGITWRSVSGPLRNAGWQLETKPYMAPTEARHVRLVFTNDPVVPEGRFSVFEVGTDFQAGGVSPSPSPTPAVSPTPAATGTISPTPSASPVLSSSPTPEPSPTPLIGPSGVPVVNVPAPGPLAARGRILLNGVPPWTPVSVSIIRSSDWSQRTVTTDAQGYFQATGLAPGNYFAYYYNETQRDRIGYWRSRTLPVDATRGAGFPQVDFGQRGLVNQPPMGARVTLPGNFEWVPPAQAVASYRFRVHSAGGRTFRLIYQSGALPGNTTTFSWNGAGTTEPLNRFNRYFWGLVWDAGPVGEGGNLYQPVYFNQP